MIVGRFKPDRTIPSSPLLHQNSIKPFNNYYPWVPLTLQITPTPASKSSSYNRFAICSSPAVSSRNSSLWCNKRMLAWGPWRFNPSVTTFDAFKGDGTQDCMVSFVLFHLQISFSINFANKLIEIYQMSAMRPVLIQQYSVLGWEDHSRPKRMGGEKNGRGSTTISRERSTTRWVISIETH
jgi:hypothetical protein